MGNFVKKDKRNISTPIKAYTNPIYSKDIDNIIQTGEYIVLGADGSCIVSMNPIDAQKTLEKLLVDVRMDTTIAILDMFVGDKNVDRENE